MEFQRLFKLSRTTRRKLLVGPAGSAIALTVFVPLLGGSTLVGAGESILDWRLGVAMWILSLVFVGASFLIGFLRLQAGTFYVLLSVVRLPLMIAFLDAGMTILERQFDSAVATLIGAALLIGLVGLPFSVRARRRWFKVAVDVGHLQWSLNNDKAEWDTSHDDDKALQDERIARPGFLIRLLPWIGPAIGLSLAGIVGRANAVSIIGIIVLSLGYGAFFIFSTYAIAYALDFRQLSRKIGRPIYIAAET